MRIAHILSSILLLLVASDAFGACAPIRLGYVDQHRPPFAVGTGRAVPAAPGATLDLVREIGASQGCAVIGVRLPPMRLRKALQSGAIDAMLMDADSADAAEFALPQASRGEPDPARALPMFTMVYVHAQDKIAAERDPAAWFAGHTLGVNNGASLAGKLRALGIRIDDGAHDTARNLEKLIRRRLDGYAATVVAPDNMDQAVAAKFGDKLARLDKPLRMQHFWLAFTRAYHVQNRAAVEAMWDWVGVHGHRRFVALARQYEHVK